MDMNGHTRIGMAVKFFQEIKRRLEESGLGFTELEQSCRVVVACVFGRSVALPLFDKLISFNSRLHVILHCNILSPAGLLMSWRQPPKHCLLILATDLD